MDYYDDYYDDYDDTSDSESDVDDEDDALYGGYFSTNDSMAKQNADFDSIFSSFRTSYSKLNQDYNYNGPISKENRIKELAKVKNNYGISDFDLVPNQPISDQTITDPIPPLICDITLTKHITHTNNNVLDNSCQLLQTPLTIAPTLTIIRNIPTGQQKPQPTHCSKFKYSFDSITPSANDGISCARNNKKNHTENTNNVLTHCHNITPTTPSQSVQANHSPANPRNKIKNKNNPTASTQNTTSTLASISDPLPHTQHQPTPIAASPSNYIVPQQNILSVAANQRIKINYKTKKKYVTINTQTSPIQNTPTNIDNSLSKGHIPNHPKPRNPFKYPLTQSTTKTNSNVWKHTKPTKLFEHSVPITQNTHCTIFNLIGGSTFMFFIFIIMGVIICYLYCDMESPTSGMDFIKLAHNTNTAKVRYFGRDISYFGDHYGVSFNREHSGGAYQYSKTYQRVETNRHGIGKVSINNPYEMAYQSPVTNRHGIGIFGLTPTVRCESFDTFHCKLKSIDESFIFYFKKSIVSLSIFDIVKGVKQTLTPTKYLNKIVGGLGDSASALLHLQLSYLSIGLYFFGGFGFLSHLFYCLINYLAGVFTMLVVALLNHYYV